MRKILVIKHVEHEGPGTIGPWLKRVGYGVETIRAWKGDRIPRDARGYAGTIVLGGPMGVYDEEKFPFITDELKFVERLLKDKAPVFGVCLGSQILARAAGARVYATGKKEIGFYDIELTGEGEKDRLLIGLPQRFKVFQWHGDTFDVPTGAVNLASSGMFDHQAIRVGDSAYGFQFHFEVTEGMVREWISINAEELAGVRDTIDPEKILEEAPVELPVIRDYGDAIIKRFLRLLELKAPCA